MNSFPNGAPGVAPRPIPFGVQSPGPAVGGISPALYDQFGKWLPPTNDPAFQPPADPMRDVEAVAARAMIIHREIPNVSIETGWTVDQVRAALEDLVVGLFDRPAMLHETVASDSRVQSAMRSRSTGLLGRPVRFTIPKRYKDEPLAQKCHRAWERHWPNMHAEPAMLQMLEGADSLGFSYQQILWDTNRKVWLPYLQSWNARYSYYHWWYRCHVAVTQDGQTPIVPGDGHWVLHAPYGQYRGWMFACLRALAQWWLARNYCLRDFAAYCEKHGFPTILADTPFGADPLDILAYQMQLRGLGQDNIVQVPGSVDVTKYGKYDLRYLEPKDANWQAFKELIQICNGEITLALLGQNLTTEVKEGSLAAARVHADVRQDFLEADARALSRTFYVQVLRPFAALNFGNADLAPVMTWNVSPAEDYKTKAEALMAFSESLNFLRLSGWALESNRDLERFARAYGVRGLRVVQVDPLQVEARIAGSTGKEKDNPDVAEPPDKNVKRRTSSQQRQDERFMRSIGRANMARLARALESLKNAA
jgi:phage gp29-like protein